MAGFSERMAAMKAKQEAADRAKQEEAEKAAAAERARAETEAKRGELSMRSEQVRAEIAAIEGDSKAAWDALDQGVAFVDEQEKKGGMDPEARGEFDALKSEASGSLEKFQSLKSEEQRIEAGLQSLEQGVPLEGAAAEAPAELPPLPEKLNTRVQ